LQNQGKKAGIVGDNARKLHILPPLINMNNQQAYNQWAGTYDEVVNPTRDLEATAIRTILGSFDLSQSKVLELGAGTGKNTEWLLEKAFEITAADFSEEMLAKAKERLGKDNISFQQTDLRERWPFAASSHDVITCSLILEHIQNLDHIFEEASRVLRDEGLFYLGELHPGKQYTGSKARFDTGNGVFELDCYIHHVSDYLSASKNHAFQLVVFEEWFDTDDRNTVPRLLTIVLKKSEN
jgi:ubiquinone/menaquinone biosynthesis C-methylase UbiE